MPSSPPTPPADGTDPWTYLRRHTAARIALGRSGGSLPTREVLAFSLAHASARDAVLAPFDAEALTAALASVGEVLLLESAAADRETYITRPDLGRRLSEVSADTLRRRGAEAPGPEVVLIVSDGLSALAAAHHAPALILDLAKRLKGRGLRLGPLCVVRHGRVGLQDEIGSLLKATLAVIVLGERPGLGVPDSLGAYFVHSPRAGRTDAERNCVSNIRTEGLAPALAAERLEALLLESLARGLSGIDLKERERPAPIDDHSPSSDRRTISASSEVG